MKRLFSSSPVWGNRLAVHGAWTHRADLFLVGLAVLGIGLHILIEISKESRPQPHMDQKMAAATRTIQCFEVIREARIGARIPIDLENDPSASGLIGQEHTLTTTDRGVLEAKLTSVNPNFAAVFVDYFHRLNLKEGDAVAFALTGSFPALNITALCAAEEMKLRPVIVTSVGASMWGANDPDLSWLDMERLLIERGLISSGSVAASLGGSNDRGRGLSPRGRRLLQETIERNGVELISEPTLEESVARRVEIYQREAGPAGLRAFVNIGGGAAAIGNSQSGRLLRPGINRTVPDYNWTRRGVLQQLARYGIPVVHILNVENIARAHGLPLSPESIPPVGEGTIFHRDAYDLKIVIPALLLYLVLCFRVLRSRQKAARVAREMAAPVISPVATPQEVDRTGA